MNNISPIKLGDRTYLLGTAVVVVLESYPVTLLNQVWFLRNEVFAEGSITEASIFTPDLVNVFGREVDVLVIPDRVQITAAKFPPTDQIGASVLKAAERLLTVGGQFKVKAIGVNFDILLMPPADSPYDEWIQILSPEILKGKCAPEVHPKYGTYFSRDEMGFRGKYKILPAQTAQFGFPPEAFEHKECLVVGVNFHRDLAADDVPVAIECASKWKQGFDSLLSVASLLP